MKPDNTKQAQLWATANSDENLAALLKPTKTIRIAVSGDVLVTNLEMRLIDAPDFQRLRRIRQLGTATLVYPTSLHTRFDHSIGTLHMATRMLESIRQNRHNSDDQCTITLAQEILIRLYALLHDVPHIPYGHTLEDELGVLERHDKNHARLEHFLGTNSQLGSIIIEVLGADALNMLRRIYTWDERSSLDGHEFIHDIVSNTVCADLLDYLDRDNLFCNLGVPLEYRFTNFLYLHRQGDRKRVFVRVLKHGTGVPRRDTLTDLCRLLETRYLIAERVYFHHAKIAGSAMLGRAVYESLKAKELRETDLYDHADDTLVKALTKSKAEVAQTLGKLLWERRLHKRLNMYQKTQFESLQQQDHRRSVLDAVAGILSNPEKRAEFEDRVAEEIGSPKGYVLVYCPPTKMNMKAASMNVIWKGKEMAFEDIDDSIIEPRLKEILSAHEQLWGVWLLASAELDEEQRSLAREAFELAFLTPGEQEGAKRREYYGHLVDRSLRSEELAIEPLAPGDYQTHRNDVVADMLATASERRPFTTRLRGSIRKHFLQKPSER